MSQIVFPILAPRVRVSDLKGLDPNNRTTGGSLYTVVLNTHKQAYLSFVGLPPYFMQKVY